MTNFPAFQTGGGNGLGSPPGASNLPTPGGPNKQAQQALARLQQQGGNNVDLSGLGTVPVGNQEPLPAPDFAWLPITMPQNQRAFSLTWNSFRPGLGMQKAPVAQGLQRLSTSSLITNAADEVILPWATETQDDQGFNGPYAVNVVPLKLASAVFKGKQVIGARQYFPLLSETSRSDPTLGIYGGATATAYCLTPFQINGQDCLIQGGGGGYGVWDSVNPFHTLTEGSFHCTDANGGFTSGADGIVQSPLPGNPLIIRSGGLLGLVPSYNPLAPLGFDGIGARMFQNLPYCAGSLGMQKVGGRTARAYFTESYHGGDTLQIGSVDAYGFNHEVLPLPMKNLLGAGIMRDGLGFVSLRRAGFWNGQFQDLGVFTNAPRSSMYEEVIIGMYTQDDQFLVEINELPRDDGTGVVLGRVRRCVRRYDFDTKRWSQVSDWQTLCDPGWIAWNFEGPPNGSSYPVPVVVDGVRGVMSAYSNTTLPSGSDTGYLHGYAQVGQFDNDGISYQPVDSWPLTWFHKFQEVPGTNPYAQDEVRPRAASGELRGPGLIFPGEAMWADKYMDAIYWGGIDSGGPGSITRIRVAEYGHMDDVDSAGNRTAIKFDFAYGLPHADRRREWPSNRTSLLFPQVSIEIIGGDDNTLTPQALPITLIAHVDQDARETNEWEVFGRSQG